MKKLLNSILLSAGLLASAAWAQSERKAEIGFEQRVRNENWNNIFDWSSSTDDQRNQIRWRTRVWASIPVSSHVTVSAGLMQETNQIAVPRSPWRFDEIAFERAYVDVKDMFVKGLSFRVGRQDVTRGDGTMLIEGNPWDGSRSIYSNAAILGYARGKTKLELMGIDNPSRDRFLPRIHDRNRLLVEWDEQAVGAYLTHQPNKQTDIEAYWFLKKEIRDTRAATNAQFRPDRHLNYWGALGRRRFGNGWSVVGEATIQRGADHASRNFSGWASDGTIKKTWSNARMAPSVSAGYWAFSGDDPSTSNTVEGWDPLFSRWPKWSELYIYSQLREEGIALWTNTRMSQVEAVFKPWKPLSWRFTWYHMDAFHPFQGSQATFGQGTYRGEMLQSRLDFTINPVWSGHALIERHDPGDFYRGRDSGYFLRFEIICRLRQMLPM